MSDRFIFDDDEDHDPTFIVRVAAGKVAELIDVTECHGLADAMSFLRDRLKKRIKSTDEIFLAQSSIVPGPLEEPTRIILASLDKEDWKTIAWSGKDTTSVEDREFSRLELLMLADGINESP